MGSRGKAGFIAMGFSTAETRGFDDASAGVGMA